MRQTMSLTTNPAKKRKIAQIKGGGSNAAEN